MVNRISNVGVRGETVKERFDYLVQQTFLPHILSDNVTACLNMDGNRGKTGIKDSKFLDWCKG